MNSSAVRDLIKVSDEFPIGFIVFREEDDGDHVICINEIMAKMCGYTSGKEMYEASHGILDHMIMKEDYTRVRSAVHEDEARQGRTPTQWCYYFRMVRKDREYLTVRAYIRIMKDPEWGKVITLYIAADQEQDSETWHDASNVVREDRILSEAIANATSAEDPDEAIDTLLKSVGETLEADRAYIFEYDGSVEGLSSYAWWKPGARSVQEDFKHMPREIFDFLWQKLLARHQNVVIRNDEELQKIDPNVAEIIRGLGIRRIIVAPLFLGSQLIGFLAVENPPAGSIGGFTRMLDFFAGFTAVLIRYRDYTRQMVMLDHQEKIVHEAITRAQLKQDPDEGLQELLCTIGSQYHSDRSNIFELEPDGNISNTYEWCEEGVQPVMEQLQHIPGRLFEHAFGKELRRNHDVVIRNMDDLGRTDSEIADLLRSAGIERVAVAPLFLENHLIGLIGIDNLDTAGMENTALLLHMIAGFAAGLIQSRDSYRRIRQQVERNEAYNRLTEKALTTHDPDEALCSFLSSIAGMVRADQAYICELESEEGDERFIYIWARDHEMESVSQNDPKISQYFDQAWDPSVPQGVILASTDVEKDPQIPSDVRQIMKDFGIRTFIQLPMTIEERPGIIGFINPRQETMKAPYTTYKMIAMFISSLLRHRDNIYHLRSLSDHDQLTGVGNRRALLAFMEKLRADVPLGMIYTDLNKLKETNDLYGHKAGDKLIQSFSRILRDHCPQKEGNEVFRLGGDEFLIVLSGRSEEETNALAEDLERAMEKGHISAAIGTVWSPTGSEDAFNEALRHADQRMYEAKRKWHATN